MLVGKHPPCDGDITGSNPVGYPSVHLNLGLVMVAEGGLHLSEQGSIPCSSTKFNKVYLVVQATIFT